MDSGKIRQAHSPFSLEALQEKGWLEPVEQAQEAGSQSSVQQVLQNLPDRYHDVLTCRFQLQLTVWETALRLGVSEAVVNVVQLRALKQAAADLDERARRVQKEA
ncbi:MAG TPA: hypothetical protein VFN35_26130 [Ktedonobacteraceae bacterium]|nr:hypothetical protein [Ktedonobacteraceae bacterium]